MSFHDPSGRCNPSTPQRPAFSAYWTTILRLVGGFGAVATTPPRSNMGVMSIVTDDPAEFVLPDKSEYCVYALGTG